MTEFTLRQIGVVRKDEAGVRLELERRYHELFLGLERYSHVNVLWWFSDNDNEEARSITMVIRRLKSNCWISCRCARITCTKGRAKA